MFSVLGLATSIILSHVCRYVDAAVIFGDEIARVIPQSLFDTSLEEVRLSNAYLLDPACTYPISVEEYGALQALYDSAHGSAWAWKEPYDEYGSPWTFPTTDISSDSLSKPCTDVWQGIRCTFLTTKTCMVVTLALGVFDENAVDPPNFLHLTPVYLF